MGLALKPDKPQTAKMIKIIAVLFCFMMGARSQIWHFVIHHKSMGIYYFTFQSLLRMV